MPRSSTPDRILTAAARRVAAEGVAAVSLQAVADEAAVSKGLIHYHFRDRDALLARLVDWLTVGVVRREQAALTESTIATALDDLWRWLEGELHDGTLRTLVELSHDRNEEVRDAVVRSRDLRCRATAAGIEQLFALLGLTPRLPPPLLATTTISFLDGLAMESALSPNGNARLVFDVYWLSVLALAE
jgi:AcrR family transcriptional regulator